MFTTLLLLVTALLAGRLTSMLHLPPLLGEVLLKATDSSFDTDYSDYMLCYIFVNL